LLEIGNQAVLLINEIRLLLGSLDPRAAAFIKELRIWLFVDDMAESADIGVPRTSACREWF
jgi:hypothetical protein